MTSPLSPRHQMGELGRANDRHSCAPKRESRKCRSALKERKEQTISRVHVLSKLFPSHFRIELVYIPTSK